MAVLRYRTAATMMTAAKSSSRVRAERCNDGAEAPCSRRCLKLLMTSSCSATLEVAVSRRALVDLYWRIHCPLHHSTTTLPPYTTVLPHCPPIPQYYHTVHYTTVLPQSPTPQYYHTVPYTTVLPHCPPTPQYYHTVPTSQYYHTVPYTTVLPHYPLYHSTTTLSPTPQYYHTVPYTTVLPRCPPTYILQSVQITKDEKTRHVWLVCSLLNLVSL